LTVLEEINLHISCKVEVYDHKAKYFARNVS